MLKEEATVTVVLASYNGEKFIERQLLSIFNQTFQDFEIVICDDCSTDRTVEIIQEYKSQYGKITLYENSANLGYVKNFEKAISLTNSHYIALSDQDDIWVLNKLELELKAIRDIELKYGNISALVHSDLMLYDEKGKCIHSSYFKMRNYTLTNEKNLGYILGPNSIMGNTLLFNKELKKIMLPFPQMLENHDYWIAVLNELYGKRVTISIPLVKYTIHSDNASNSQLSLQNKLSASKNVFNYISGNVRPPYVQSERAVMLQNLLEKSPDLNEEDRHTIRAFIHYLQQKGSRAKRIVEMLKYGYTKQTFSTKLKSILKILLSRDY